MSSWWCAPPVVSVWQFLAPVVLATLVIGGLRVGVYNPVSAELYGQFERTRGGANLPGDRDSLLDVGPGGLCAAPAHRRRHRRQSSPRRWRRSRSRSAR